MLFLTLFAYRPGTLIGIAAILAWLVCWVIGAIDIFKRRDLSTVGRIVWLLVLILLPIVGLLVYYIASAFSGTSSR
jgi:hypothetical protein